MKGMSRNSTTVFVVCAIVTTSLLGKQIVGHYTSSAASEGKIERQILIPAKPLINKIHFKPKCFLFFVLNMHFKESSLECKTARCFISVLHSVKRCERSIFKTASASSCLSL